MLAKFQAIRRRRQGIAIAALALTGGALLLALVAAAVALDWHFGWSRPAARWVPPLISFGIVFAVWGGLARRLKLTQPVRRDAREIDRAIPGLEERWSTVAELSGARRDPALAGSPELIARVIAEAEAFAGRVRPGAVIPAARLRRPAAGFAAGMAMLAVAGFCVSGISGHCCTASLRRGNR